MQADHAFFISRELEINRSFGVTESNFAISTISFALKGVLPVKRADRETGCIDNLIASSFWSMPLRAI